MYTVCFQRTVCAEYIENGVSHFICHLYYIKMLLIHECCQDFCYSLSSLSKCEMWFSSTACKFYILNVSNIFVMKTVFRGS